ncbi:MAG: phage major capsid protein [Plesiomonas sp.]|uniref:phage major capsid protein n=1 Tax=Plesiomonas sp. TaxID=2486279 RepID=UPI003F3A1658
MSKLHEMQQRRDTIAREMRDLNEKIADAQWSPEQRASWDGMTTELRGLDDKIKREIDMRAADESFARDHSSSDDSDSNHNTEARDAFDAYLRHGLSEMSAEQRSALNEMRAQAASVGDKGGYTVPRTLLAKVVESMKQYGGIASVSQIISTDSGNPIDWATSDGTAEEGELVGENVQTTEGDAVFGSATLGAKKLSSKIIRVSNELLSDSGIDIEAFLSGRIAQRIGRGEAKLLVKGTGAGSPAQPRGLEASVSGGVTGKTTLLLDYLDLTALKHSVDPAYRASPKTRWAFNDATLQLITEMKDATGRPLWLPAVAGMTPAQILDHEYVIDQGIDAIGVGKKFMFFGDFDNFIIRRVNYMVLKRLVERFAEFDQTGFLAFHRFDCCLQDAAAIKALTGK